MMMKARNTENISSRTAKRWGLIALLFALPVYFAVDHFSGSGRARAAAVTFGIMVIVIRAFWSLRKQKWYWFTIALLTVIQLVLVVAVPWTGKNIPAPILWPVGITDFVLASLLIKGVEKFMIRRDNLTSAP